ncbi:MAG: patatin-like phospholipase family protein [Bacilli bacterium]|nr:patatin-like phospholipase family protein [Bacilli bacterium]MBN2877382.1 patatin-like phospholipase family protein [Bacilli bacterium]
MKLGLCLSGGGSRGSYQIGACMALKEAGIWDKIDVISGTSIGAANAALLACKSIEEVRDIWFDMPEETLKHTEGFFRRLVHERAHIMVNGLYEIDNLETILTSNLDYRSLKQKKVYVTLASGGPEDEGIMALLKASYKHYIKRDYQVVYSPLWQQDQAHINKQIIASCSIPIVFPPTTIEGQHYYDGGVYDNVPVKPLVDENCDTIIVIHLDRLPYRYKYHYPDIVFHPIKSKRSLGFPLKFEANQAMTRYQMGYEDMTEYLKKNRIL